MDSIKKNIAQKFDDIVRAHDHFLIELIVRGDKNLPIIEVFVDNVDGVTTTGCAAISRELDEYLLSTKFVNEKYRLDVSSPGVERPLKFLEQYKKHINRKFEVKYIIDENKALLEGKLIRIENDKLFFLTNEGEIHVRFEDITSAMVQISF
ncbi:MAG: hypothetical protein K9J12_11285 [Melioribacteraceae bacterium]|nr:hypothetical protein [Melioribacteraceae bacterium]MCF8266326.1 hypothetical protein [Melioribacteraceae bacterium]MCF8411830.1 hypothetical protein [Melioribacteraceae bacterium]